MLVKYNTFNIKTKGTYLYENDSRLLKYFK